MVISKAERIAELLDRLTAATPATTAGEAFDLLTTTFNSVEDEFAGDDDRMFPPSGDYEIEIEGRSDLLAFKQVVHTTIFAPNGAITILVRKTGKIFYEKAGANGRKVEL